MIRICVIGNSHAAALKSAWDNLKYIMSEVSITFFCHRGEGVRALQIKDGVLVPSNDELLKAIEFTSGGKLEIDTRKYDLFLIYGLGSNRYIYMDSSFFSKAVIKEAVKDLLENTSHIKLAKQLKKLTNKPIFIALPPFPAKKSHILTTGSNPYEINIKEINHLVYEPLNIELIAQPSSTICSEGETCFLFNKNAERLNIGDLEDGALHLKSVLSHMNHKYGDVWLKEFLADHLYV